MVGNLTTRHNEFLAIQQSWSGPSDSLAVTPGASDAMGSWTSVFTADEDSYGIYLQFFDGAAVGVSNCTLVDIGVDPAGGTSYGVLIPYLNAASALGMGAADAPGHMYFFPLFIPKGAAIAARAAQGGSVANAFAMRAMLLQKPTRPELLRVGSRVEAIGIQTTGSRGTPITFNTTTDARDEGPWNSLGTSAKEGFFFQVGAGSDDADRTTAVYALDFSIGSVSGKRTILQDLWFGANSSEEIGVQMWPEPFCYGTFPAGTEFFVRAESSTAAPDTDVFAMLYVVGGN